MAIKDGTFEDKICEAIETIANNAVANAGYDKTVQATIITIDDVAAAKYKVRYQNSVFYAYASNVNVTYENGTEVYVLIPGNDTGRAKTIIGTIKNQGIVSSDLVEEEDYYETVGKAFVEDDTEYNFCSYNEDSEIILYNKTKNINLINLSTTEVEEYLSQSDYLKISGYFRTNLDTEQRYKGNYGIKCILNLEENKTKEIYLDVNSMEGNPYLFKTSSYQYSINTFDIENFIDIEQISIFTKDFPTDTKNEHEDDIFISKIIFEGVKYIIPTSVLSDTNIVLETPQGIYFDDTMTENETRRINAIVTVKGKEITSGLEYYWFQEDLTIDTSSLYYHRYGGNGWRCINDYTEITDEVAQWNTTQKYIDIKKSQLISKLNNFKCVVIYNGTNLNKELTMDNTSSDFILQIGQSSEDNYPDLTCLINGLERIDSNYSYQWYKISSGNYYEKLDDTTELNEEYQTAVTNYNQLKTEIDSGQKLPAAYQAELDGYKAIIDKDDKLPRVDKNKVYNIDLNTIDTKVTFKCGVFYQSNYIGCISVDITFGSNSNGTKQVILNNGVQLFKYNASNIAPTNESLENPMVLQPLSFTFYSETGKKIDFNSILRNGTVTWEVPKRNTMLRASTAYTVDYFTDDYNYYYGLETFTYTLADSYNDNYINNNINLSIEYDNNIYIATTNFTFLKEGDPGTDTSDFVVRIIPNSTSSIDRVCIRNGQLNFEARNENIPFLVQLWNNGQKIFENNISGTSTEGNEVDVQWAILGNRYTTSITDRSALGINSTTGQLSYSGFLDDNPANIIKCIVKYQDNTYSSVLPITTITSDTRYILGIIPNSGFNKIIYDAAGKNPSYSRADNFGISVLQNINGLLEDISQIQNEYKLTYTWQVCGSIYNTSTRAWENAAALKIYNTSSDNIAYNEKYISVETKYEGLCVTNGILITIYQGSTYVGKIHIPIYVSLTSSNTTEDINGWDGTSVAINSNGGFILTPKLGSGTQDNNNNFSGFVVAKVQEPNNSETQNGMFGYYQGFRSFFVNGDTGAAALRVNGAQVTVDPVTNELMAYTTNYWKEYDNNYFPKNYTEDNKTGQGMMINLTNPEISIDGNNILTLFTKINELENRIQNLSGGE